MTIETIRELLEGRPFRPFTIHLADGRSLPVPHRDFVARTPTGRTLIVTGADDRVHIIDLLLVTSIELHPDTPSATAGTSSGAT